MRKPKSDKLLDGRGQNIVDQVDPKLEKNVRHLGNYGYKFGFDSIILEFFIQE